MLSILIIKYLSDFLVSFFVIYFIQSVFSDFLASAVVCRVVRKNEIRIRRVRARDTFQLFKRNVIFRASK